DIHGVHDWNKVIQNFVPSYDPVALPEIGKKAWESSPVAFLDGWRSPVLLIHGDDDRNVPFNETVALGESLRDRKVYFEQLIFPDEVHGFLLYRNWVSAYKATADFFDRMLAK
ncbi:MAG: prolyl oligopeptidase family serine peptidase, partial [Bacteroidetes bacterium]|nr:prolyl oligopeptidase family serine peptidase [Bacteroidota bacterium]